MSSDIEVNESLTIVVRAHSISIEIDEEPNHPAQQSSTAFLKTKEEIQIVIDTLVRQRDILYPKEKEKTDDLYPYHEDL
jgi:hypothetical protein